MHSKRHRRMFILSLPRSRLVLQIGIDKLPSTGVSRIPIQLAYKILMYAEDLMTQYRNHHSLHGSISSQTCAQLDNSTRLSEAGFFFFFCLLAIDTVDDVFLSWSRYNYDRDIYMRVMQAFIYLAALIWRPNKEGNWYVILDPSVLV